MAAPTLVMEPQAPAANVRARRPAAIPKPNSEATLSAKQIRHMALQTLRNLTLGMEQEVFVIGQDGKIVNLNHKYKSLNVSAKDGAPRIGDGILGAVNEAGAGIREFITEPISVGSAGDIRDMIDRLDSKIAERLKREGLMPLLTSLPLLVPNGGMKVTDHPRYREVDGRDQNGFRHGMQTASMQINIGTIPAPLRARLVGMAGDSGHLIRALASSTPFSWSQYGPDITPVWKRHHKGRAASKKAHLIDTDMASIRPYVWNEMRTARIMPPIYDQQQYDKSRAEALMKAGVNPIPGNLGLDHSTERITVFGRELREPDSVPTKEERELLCILGVTNLVRDLRTLVNNPDAAQTPLDEREKNFWSSSQQGMQANFVDPKTRQPMNAYALQRKQLNEVRGALEAYERGDYEGVLDAPADSSSEQMPSESTLYNRAMEVLARVQELGTPAERMKGALNRYRNDHGIGEAFAPHTPEGVRIVTEDEALFLHGFLLAEQRLGLFADREVVFDKALEYQSLAYENALPFDLDSSLGLSLT